MSGLSRSERATAITWRAVLVMVFTTDALHVSAKRNDINAGFCQQSVLL